MTVPALPLAATGFLRAKSDEASTRSVSRSGSVGDSYPAQRGKINVMMHPLEAHRF